MDKLEALKKCDVFRDLSDEQLSAVEKICTPEVFDAGAIICKQGKREKTLYVVEEGLVGIILEVGPLAKRQVQAVSNFESFGWSAMLEPYFSTATVKALEQTKALAFDGQDLRDLCTIRPEIGYRVSRGLARVIAGRLRQAYTQLLGVTDED
jgi:CRP/FNR family cyclic AMP-dependent transcriptional regulator